MAKPSIFSRDYEKKMRRRKNRIIVTAIGIVVALSVAAVYSKGSFKSIAEYVNNKKNNITLGTKKQDSPATKQDNSVSKQDASTVKQENTPEVKQQKVESYSVVLSDGTTVNAIYEGKDNNRAFKSVSPAEANIQYSISPAGKNIVFFDPKVQSIILLDISGNKQDITYPQYVSTNGEVITKESRLSAQPGYIWCSSPRFIDESNIAYISQLPWIGKTAKYVWIENIQNKTYQYIQSIEGEDIKFDKLTEKGLTVIVSGKTIYLTPNGSISQ